MIHINLREPFINNKIKIKSIYHNNINYKIVNYDKDFLCDDNKELRKYRSLIISNNKLVCFSSPKTLKYEEFIKLYQEESGYIPEDIRINEIIEGTKINLFYDFFNKKWEISTNNNIGDKYYYKLFIETFGCNQNENINDIDFFANLNKEYCYNFILQHPNDEINEKNINYPTIFLISIYKIMNSNKNNIKNSNEYNCIAESFGHECIDVLHIPLYSFTYNILKYPNVFLPREHKLHNYNYQEIKDNYCSKYTDPNFVGFMFTDEKTGERMAIYNERYKNVKENQKEYSQILYLYLNVMKTNKLKDFLKNFPIYKKPFYKYYELYKNFVDIVHNAYILKFVNNNNNKNIDKNILSLINKIHKDVFIHSIKNTNKTIVTRQIVWKYLLEKIPIYTTMYCMIRQSSNNNNYAVNLL